MIVAEWLTISAVTAPDGNITHYVGTFSDITENKDAVAEIHRLAYYDPLTHLPNRRLLQDRLGQILATRISQWVIWGDPVSGPGQFQDAQRHTRP